MRNARIFGGMNTYTASKNGQTVSRKSDHCYTHCVVAVYPDNSVKMISCHNGQAKAQAASLKRDGTAGRWLATRAGATFEVLPLTIAATGSK